MFLREAGPHSFKEQDSVFTECLYSSALYPPLQPKDKRKERKPLKLKNINTNENSAQIWKEIEKDEKELNENDRRGGVGAEDL